MPFTNLSFPENLPSEWQAHLSVEKDKDYFAGLVKFLAEEYRGKKTVYPSQENILRALQLTNYADVKVLILGQDPYHGPEQAVGLSFAVPDRLRLKPPSLQNIFKEISADLSVNMAGASSELVGWARQGVLLLNTVLTVLASQAFSHRDKGWEFFTDRIIQVLNEREDPVIFLLWGAAAQKKKALITHRRHKILESAHPSPLSAHRGFLGSKPFSKINSLLNDMGKAPIDWTKS